MQEALRMKIEEFNVKVEKEGSFFVATIEFPNGEKQVTQGKNILDCYDMIADLLKIRVDEESPHKTSSEKRGRK